MNKANLILSLTRVLSTRKECSQAIDKIFSEMSKALARGEKVVISGFGSFHPYIAKSRKGINPRTKQSITIPPKRKVRFIPSKDLF